MLTIRLQRTGRKGHANFRVVVQDSRQSPTSGKFVALLGSYDPHNKTVTLEKNKAEFYLKNGAHPSNRVATLLKTEGVKLPKWLELTPPKKKETRHPEKLRKNRPAGAPEPEKPQKEAETKEGESVAENQAEETTTEVSETASADEPIAEIPPTDSDKDSNPAAEDDEKV